MEIFKCNICQFGTIFHSSSSEPWLTCERCKVRMHFSCAKSIGCSVACTCLETGSFEVDETVCSVTEDYKKMVKEPSTKSLKNPNDIPYALYWNSSEVEEFLKKLGFKKEAEQLSCKNIDGFKLLTLTKQELTSFGFKIGPALKIWRNIEFLRFKVLHSPMRKNFSIKLSK